jgi:hypothetical protein
MPGVSPTTNKSPPSRAERLVGSRIIEDHITVGQARDIANADKVCGAPLQRLAHMDAQRLACEKRGVAHLPPSALPTLPCKEGRPKSFRDPKRQGHAQRSRYGPAPAAPLLRVADSRSRSRSRSRRHSRRRPCRVDISFEGRYRERSPKCATASGGGQSNGGYPSRGRGSPQALLRGCHVPSPGLVSKMNALFRSVAKICPGFSFRAEESFSKGYWLLAFLFQCCWRVGGEGRQQTTTTTGELELLPSLCFSLRQTGYSSQLPLPSSLRQPEASGLPWSYDRLTPPTSGPTLANVDCRPKNPIGAKSSHRAYHQLCCYAAYACGPAFVLLCYFPPLGHSACAAGRTLICVIFDGAHLLEHLGRLGSLQTAAVRFGASSIICTSRYLADGQPQLPKFVQEPCLIVHGRGLSTTDQDGQNLPIRIWPSGARINPSPRPSRHQDPRNGRFFRHQWPRSRPFCHPSEHPHELLSSVTR